MTALLTLSAVVAWAVIVDDVRRGSPALLTAAAAWGEQ